MGSGAGAAVGVVTELMDMNPTFSVGVVASDVVADAGFAGLGGLFKGHGAGDLGIATEDCNCSVESQY